MHTVTTGGTSVTPGDLIADRYLVDAWLGQGHMAVVYRATHQGTGKACALKVVHPHLASRREIVDLFVREAQVGARIGASPHIVDVFDAGIDHRRGLPFLVMELLHGRSLDQHLKEYGALDAGLTRALFEQLAEALDQAHGAGVVHRDLKPSNLFLTRDKRGQPILKVVDFGIAKVLEHEAQRTATQVGSPAYASPEQLGQTLRKLAAKQGITISQGVSPASDVWAMGLIAYEVLTGHSPAQYWNHFETLSDLIMRIALEDPEPATVRAGPRAHLLPFGFDSWFARCLRKNAAERWSSAGEATRELARLWDAPRIENLKTIKMPLRDVLIAAQVMPETAPQTLPDTVKLPAEVVRAAQAGPTRGSSYPPVEPPWQAASSDTSTVEMGREDQSAVPPRRPTYAAKEQQRTDAPAGQTETETQPPGLLPAYTGVAGTKHKSGEEQRPPRKVIYAAALGTIAVIGIVGFVVWPRSGALRIEVRTEQGASIDRAEIFVDGQKRCEAAPCIVAGLSAGPKSVKVVTENLSVAGPVDEIVEGGRERAITITVRNAGGERPMGEPKPNDIAPPTEVQEQSNQQGTPDKEGTDKDEQGGVPSSQGAASLQGPRQGTQGSAPPTASASISVNSVPASKVLVDGRPIGSTPKVGYPVKPGAHTVELIHPTLGHRRVMVNVISNELKVVSVRF